MIYTCVSANDTLLLQFLTYDPDSIDSVYLALNNANIGNIFRGNQPCSYYAATPLQAAYLWAFIAIPLKEMWNGLRFVIISGKNPYQVDFYAHDNYLYYGFLQFDAFCA